MKSAQPGRENVRRSTINFLSLIDIYIVLTCQIMLKFTTSLPAF